MSSVYSVEPPCGKTGKIQESPGGKFVKDDYPLHSDIWNHSRECILASPTVTASEVEAWIESRRLYYMEMETPLYTRRHSNTIRSCHGEPPMERIMDLQEISTSAHGEHILLERSGVQIPMTPTSP